MIEMIPLLLVVVGIAGIVFCGFWATSIKHTERKKIELRETAIRATAERQDRDRLRAESRKRELEKAKENAARAVSAMTKKK